MIHHFNDRPAAQAATVIIPLYALLGVTIFAAIGYILLKGAS